MIKFSLLLFISEGVGRDSWQFQWSLCFPMHFCAKVRPISCCCSSVLLCPHTIVKSTKACFILLLSSLTVGSIFLSYDIKGAVRLFLAFSKWTKICITHSSSTAAVHWGIDLVRLDSNWDQSSELYQVQNSRQNPWHVIGKCNWYESLSLIAIKPLASIQ